jgi:hypothetical protein
MKKLILSALFVCVAAFSSNAQTPTQQEGPSLQDSVKFESLVHDFGNVPANSQARHEFVFTNQSKQPLEIKNVRASCGCTAPSYSKEPVPTGKTGSVVAVYSAPSAPQSFAKTITVETSHGTFRLTIKGNVVEEVTTPQSPVRLNK